jgi:hypothetical protein
MKRLTRIVLELCLLGLLVTTSALSVTQLTKSRTCAQMWCMDGQHCNFDKNECGED